MQISFAGAWLLRIRYFMQHAFIHTTSFSLSRSCTLFKCNTVILNTFQHFYESIVSQKNELLLTTSHSSLVTIWSSRVCKGWTDYITLPLQHGEHERIVGFLAYFKNTFLFRILLKRKRWKLTFGRRETAWFTRSTTACTFFPTSSDITTLHIASVSVLILAVWRHEQIRSTFRQNKSLASIKDDWLQLTYA